MSRRKIRHCKSCGEKLPPGRLWLCEACSAAGVGFHTARNAKINAQELLEVALERQEWTQEPLYGMSMEEIAAIASLYCPGPYGSYGKLRSYVREMHRLPPLD